MPNVTAAPLFIDHPYVKLGDATTGVEVECACTNVTATPDQDTTTVETFCGSYTSYKAEKWTITLSVAMSYGADGFWNLVRPLVGQVVAFELRPDMAVGSVDNPAMTGTAIVKGFPFIDAAPGEASEVDVELGVQGPPVWNPATGTFEVTATQTEPANA